MCSDKQFSFQITTECGWQLRIGAGREFQVEGPATAKLRGLYRSVLVAGTARSPRAAECKWRRPAEGMVQPVDEDVVVHGVEGSGHIQ